MSKSTKSLFLSSGLALAIMSIGQPALAQTATESLTDVRQEVQIWTTYALNPYLRANDLKVTVKNGKATLTGNVPEGVNKELAKEIALGVNGIKEVDNQIVVDGEKPVTHAAPVGSYGEVIDDATITVAVKSKLLWSKHTDSLKTTVETKSGRVTLSGTADSEAARDLAGRLAANTRGVISVRNMLKVVPAVKAAAATTSTVTGAPAGSVLPQVSTAKAEQAVSDTWITTKVKSTLLYSSNVSGADITVTTVAGVVTLKGKLDSGAERALAIELAQNVKGVKSVNAKDVTF
ncbi:MAG: BON domain-containing protein [Sheuella sp.]|nr:BON domain-containing protein [Sheuella sp.]